MARSQESFNKKEVRSKKEKKRKEKEKRRQAKREGEKKSLDDMIAYVDEHGNITDTPPDPDEKEEVELEDIEVSVPKSSAEDQEDQVKLGTVSYFNTSKGFGFIKDSSNRQDVFFHINNAYSEITEGHRVSFEMGTGPKGPVAINVQQVK